MDPYATHLPPLARALTLFRGPVLEIGIGHYSSRLIRALCRDRITSIENNLAWQKTLGLRGEIFRSPWKGHTPPPLTHFDVVFVDGDADERARWVLEMLPRCRALVLHDSNPELDHIYHHLDPLSAARYSWTYNRVYPHTTVASMCEDVGRLFGDLNE